MPSHVEWYTSLISSADAQAVLDALPKDAGLTPPDMAVSFAQTLLGFYPTREVNDAKTYVTALATVFGSFPPSICKRILHPVEGLPSRLKFLPTVADLVEALKAEQTRREMIRRNAARTIAMNARAREPWNPPDDWPELTPEQKAERSRRLDELKANLRLKNMQEAETQ